MTRRSKSVIIGGVAKKRPWPRRYEVTVQYADGTSLQRTVTTWRGEARARSLVLSTIPPERILEAASVVEIGASDRRSDVPIEDR